MDSLILFIITYGVMFLLYLIFFYIIGLKRKNILKSIQVDYLKIKFKLKNKDFIPKKIGIIICLIDPLIISLSGTIATLPKWHYALEIMIGFVLLMMFIYSFYEILGRSLIRKVDKNEYKRNRK